MAVFRLVYAGPSRETRVETLLLALRATLLDLSSLRYFTLALNLTVVVHRILCLCATRLGSHE